MIMNINQKKKQNRKMMNIALAAKDIFIKRKNMMKYKIKKKLLI